MVVEYARTAWLYQSSSVRENAPESVWRPGSRGPTSKGREGRDRKGRGIGGKGRGPKEVGTNLPSPHPGSAAVNYVNVSHS